MHYYIGLDRLLCDFVGICLCSLLVDLILEIISLVLDASHLLYLTILVLYLFIDIETVSYDWKKIRRLNINPALSIPKVPAHEL
jgi:hypothetical protein